MIICLAGLQFFGCLPDQGLILFDLIFAVIAFSGELVNGCINFLLLFFILFFCFFLLLDLAFEPEMFLVQLCFSKGNLLHHSIITLHLSFCGSPQIQDLYDLILVFFYHFFQLVDFQRQIPECFLGLFLLGF